MPIVDCGQIFGQLRIDVCFNTKKSDSLDKENNDSWRMKPRKSV